MMFKDLSQYFEKLEHTSSRLVLIEILSELFKGTPADEIEQVVYLIQGRLAAFFVPLEIGMAEKTVAQSIANAYGLSREEVLKSYQKLGDMGLVASDLSQKSKVKSQKSEISVDEVFKVLTEIANMKGEGTVEKRQTLLSNLLNKLDSTSAKHLVRIPLGNTRLGIGDPTVLDGLATAKLGDKSKRKLLEGAYNRTSDLGLIAKTLWEKGLVGVEKLEVRVGAPIRSELCERLPTPEKVI
ncbi:MAG: DNA ligase, partial [Patescibacteria group bacterium]|nr:DNA ligase [Patescibacteria group bacterium]